MKGASARGLLPTRRAGGGARAARPLALRSLGVLGGALLAVASLAAPDARAGPPLVTEDPGVVAQGRVEVIVATTLARESAGTEYATPLLDVTAGLAEGLEAAIVVPWLQVDPEGEGGRAGLGLAATSLKLRLLGGPTHAFELAFAPRLVFDLPEDRGVVADATTGVLPLTGEGRRGAWRLGGELGAELLSGSRDRGRAGIYAGHAWASGLELLGELRGDALWNGSDSFFAWRLGATWQTRADVELQLGIGRSFASGAPRRAELEVFVGARVPFELSR